MPRIHFQATAARLIETTLVGMKEGMRNPLGLSFEAKPANCAEPYHKWLQAYKHFDAGITANVLG